jgi:predicted phosphodiesterase
VSAVLRDVELFSVGTDEVVVTCATDTEQAVTTRVGEHEVTTHGRFHTARVAGLEPSTEYALAVDGAATGPLLPPQVTTLDRPPGRLLATFATANDVHFGEVACGMLGTPEEPGPVFRAEPGETPYPHVMNRAAVEEMRALDADAVVVKGDLTNLGTEEEYETFLATYGTLGPRMHHVRGNHDAMITATIASAHAPFDVRVTGAVLAVLDTVVPGIDRGALPASQLEWLDDLAAASPDPVLVFGHHHPWDPTKKRSDTYFGINPDDSEALCGVIARREAIVGYFAGHTHRNRVRRFPEARDVPMVEVACVKDYPGAWAEYRVYEGGYTQVVRRVAAPDARAWTEKTRHMFQGMYRDYALGGLDDRCLAVRY